MVVARGAGTTSEHCYQVPPLTHLPGTSSHLVMMAKPSVDRGRPDVTSLSSKESNCQSSILARTASTLGKQTAEEDSYNVNRCSGLTTWDPMQRVEGGGF